MAACTARPSSACRPRRRGAYRLRRGTPRPFDNKGLEFKDFDFSERTRGFAFSEDVAAVQPTVTAPSAPASIRLTGGLDAAAAENRGDASMAALITAADLGIDTRTDQGLFDWLLASLLFGRPVQQQTAATAYRKFKADGWDTPEHFTADDQHPLWHELWEGDYHRLSSVMSEELRTVMRALSADYGGSAARLVRTAGSRAEVTARLEQFKGVGPKTAKIFLREVPDALIGTE
jgi:hypothetical protein